MSVLVDTNVLLRIAQVGHPGHAAATEAVLKLTRADFELCVSPQVIYEFWVAATRPLAANGLGMPVPLVERTIRDILIDYHLLRDERGVFGRWHSLVVLHDVKGKNAHDARLVAAMQRHGLTNLLTFNKPDFARFAAIEVYTPAEVLAGRLPS
ncbi:MAG: type II toxin-antitoxin system VapC family toxin [Planctomycetaceae bacterium]|nr:type II toxin-antitoxin system VapC family toxin [Planctomycetaceae bacterium]